MQQKSIKIKSKERWCGNHKEAFFLQDLNKAAVWSTSESS